MSMLKGSSFLFVLGLLMALSCGYQNIAEPDNSLPCLKIDLKAEQRIKLRRNREAALRTGILQSKDEDYVSAQLNYEGQLSPGQLRLKGDWLDHLKSSKWSYRVKLDSTNSFLGMQKFSVQHPKTRSYLDEYVFHLLLMEENILTTQYDFINVQQNGINQGIYAIEEHFDRILLEKQGRREGPILKFDEDGFWEAQKYLIENKKDPNFFSPIFEAAEIKPFESNNILSDSILFQEFLSAKLKLEDLRSGIRNLDKLVDLDKMAKFFALCDIAQAYHSLTWHNLRFYYNPLNGKLEPVVFDAYSSAGVYQWFSKPFLGYYSEKYGKVYFRQEFMIFQFFNHPVFKRKYLFYLKKFCEPNFVEDFFSRHKEKLTELEDILSKEFRDFQYDWSFLPERVNILRSALKDYNPDHPPFQFEIFEPNYTNCMVNYPLSHTSLSANKIQNLAKGALRIRNYFCEPIRLIATGPTKSRPIHPFTEPIKLASYDIHLQPQPDTVIFIPPQDKFIFYEIESNSAWYRAKLSNIPEYIMDPILDTDMNSYDSSLFYRRNDTLFLTRGKYCLDRLQIFPEYLTLVIEAGVDLDLVKDGGFLIKGDLLMNGQKDLLINIYSSDGNSNGVTMTGPAKANISWANFKSIDPVKNFGTAHSGGLSFHQVTLKMQHCQISDMNSEDGVNIVSSQGVHLEDLIFKDCREDALDIDFSTADIVDCKFTNVRGDAIDLSGSSILLDGVIVKSVGDKGLSIGENTSANVENLAISKGFIGIAVKDGSEVNISNLTVDSTDFAITVFTKKNYYSTSTLHLYGISLTGNRNDICVESTQKVILEDQQMTMTDTLEHYSKILYPNVE